jgi:hypothetical protein
MPKQMLEGTLEEQCEILYDLAMEKMKAGNYTGAIHALQEIADHNPDFRNVSDLLETARRNKRTHRNLLVASILGASLFVGIGTLAQVQNDLILFALAIVGLLVGYGSANFISSYRR